MSTDSEFDKFADSYRDCVNSTLTLSGEDSDYFAQGRVAWLRKIFSQEPNIHHIMDYGCGIGLGVPHLLTLPNLTSLIGVDVSEKSLAHARSNYASDRVSFASFAEYQPSAEIDLVVCCNVFHHIAHDDRPAAVKYIYDSLRPGGWLALWEHNPWNPVVVYVMNHSPIDQDAIRVKPHQARRMMRVGGFSIVKTDYLFFFPSFLSMFRGLEPLLSRVPFGGQYLTLCRKT
jgi:SAM-dependent methyltransferase